MNDDEFTALILGTCCPACGKQFGALSLTHARAYRAVRRIAVQMQEMDESELDEQLHIRCFECDETSNLNPLSMEAEPIAKPPE